jgi:hypothetical protein
MLGNLAVVDTEEIEERRGLTAESPVCTENLIRVDGVMESPKLAE